MTGQQFFKRVSDPADKMRLLEDLAKSRFEIQVKIPGTESVHTTKAFEFNGEKVICILPVALKNIDKTGSIIFSFFIGGEKYFMDANYKVIAGELVVSIPENIFHLQRRDHYRIRIPAEFSALFEFTSVNGKLLKGSAVLFDLSAGGCKMEIDSSKAKFENDDQIKGELFLNDRKPIPVTGKIKHLQKKQSDKLRLWVGLQFVDLSEKEKNRIGSLVMDLYREFFAKYR